MAPNYRICWAQGIGYFGQFLLGEGGDWHNVPQRSGTSKAAARLDCKLTAALAGEECRISGELVNMTPRSEETPRDN